MSAFPGYAFLQKLPHMASKSSVDLPVCSNPEIPSEGVGYRLGEPPFGNSRDKRRRLWRRAANIAMNINST
jgi:hypothetical protein